MALKQPQSAEECLYFTNRAIDSGKAMAWVYRKECPKCKKGRLGKPIKKNGKVDKKAEFYQCPQCGFQENMAECENSLSIEVIYKCPHCGKEGETTAPYKRRTWQGIPSYVFECKDCGKTIGITKKLKSKGSAGEG